MTKRSGVSLLILLVSCIPYAFLLMYWDRQFDMLLFYPLLAAAYAGLGWFCGKTKRVALAVTGSFVSCIFSLLLAFRYLLEDSHYFKPFGITGLVLFLCIYTLAVQMLIWKWQRGGKEAPLVIQFFEILAMLLVPTVIIILLILLIPHVW